MVITWSDLPAWLLTSFVGAAIVKALDLAVSRYQDAHRLRQEKARVILAYLDQYGDLAQLYRFLAVASSKVVRRKDGTLKTDKQGKFVVEKKLFEPEPHFEEAIKSLTGTGISSAITLKIASIRLASARAFDSAFELDPSGELRDRLDDVYFKTVSGIDFALRSKNPQEWGTSISNMVTALKEADEARRQAQAVLSKYLR